MTDQARIDELLDQWESAWEEGRPLSAGELCTQYPELTETVATQIRALKATSWLNETDGAEEDFLSLPPQLSQSSFTVPASLSLEELTSKIAASGLLTTGQLQLVDASTANELAAALIGSRQLTEYQVRQICDGNTAKLVLGNYVILDVIGAGGMGEVFKARHTRMKRVVALKILPEKAVGSPMAVERFHREVEAAARLTHPNIVVAHDADEYEGTHFLVMEFVPGADLSSLVKQQGPLPIGQAVDCIIQAAKGLEYAHGEGVVHRDIKPANLLLDKKGKVKILDMGLARFDEVDRTDGFAATQAELTVEGTVLGTIDYLAPEQALDTRQADARADIYSLGCTLYYLLIGQALYSGSSLMAKMLAHREEEIPSMRDHRSDVPDELAAIFAKMVAKQPDDRYASMSALLADLEGLAAKYAEAWQPEKSDTAVSVDEKTLADSPAHDTSSAGVADTLKFTPAPDPTAASSKSSRTGRRWLLAMAGLAAALLFGVILIQTPDGTIRIETNQTDVEVLVDGKQVVYITDPKDKTKITVTIPKGAKRLRVRKAGFEADVNEFKLNTVKGLVKVSFVPVKGPVVGGDVDRAVAEWALGVGAQVVIAIDGDESDINKRRILKKGEQLPQEDFRVTSLHFLGTVHASVADMKRLAGLSSLRRLVGTLRVSGKAVAQLARMKTLTDLDAVDENWLRYFQDSPLIRLGAFDISDKGYELLARHKSVERLLLIGDEATDAGLAQLSKMHKLNHVQMEERNLTDEGLKHLAGLKNLNSLSMRFSQVTGTGFENFRQTPLSNIGLSDCPVTDEGLAVIARLDRVYSLHLNNTQITDAGLRLLAQMSKLIHLHLAGTQVTDAGLQHLKGRTALTQLGLARTQVSDKGLEYLKGLTDLRMLYLSETQIGDAGLEQLTALKKLTHLDLTKTKVTAAGVAALQKSFPNCKITWDGNTSPDRTTAEWVLSIGGSITTNGRIFTTVAKLPAGTFEIRVIDLYNKPQVTDDDLQHIAGLENLQTLALTRAQVTDRGLEHLKGLIDLSHLNLGYSQIKGPGLAHLQDLTKLGYLNLQDTRVDDASLNHLKGLTNLNYLDLARTQVSDAGLQSLKGLTELIELDLAQTGVSDKGLEYLTGLRKLRYLTLSVTKVTDLGIADLQKALPNCKITRSDNPSPDRKAAEWVLSIGGKIDTDAGRFTTVAKLPTGPFEIRNIDLYNKPQVTDDDLQHLAGLDNLSLLALTRAQVSDRGLEHLKGLTDLSHLNVGDTQIKGPGLAHLQNLTRLAYLNFQGTQIDDTSLKQLTRLKNLTTLHLSRSRVTAQGVAELQKALPKCKIEWDGNNSPDREAAEWVLSIGGSISTAAGKFIGFDKLPPEPFQIEIVDLFNKRQLKDDDLLHIKGLTKLNTLNLMHSQVTDSGLEHLQGLTNLVRLSLGNTRIQGKGLAHLKGMTKLQSLNLLGTQVDDASLNHLKGLTNLSHLDLIRTRVSDAGLQSLTRLTKLRVLTLGETTITDEGLKHLTGFKDLTTLRLTKTKVTAQGVTNLQRALPRCNIEWDGASQ